MNRGRPARGEPGWRRLVAAGLTAGAVINACEWAAHHWWLEGAWTEAFAALGKSPTGWSTFIPANLWLGIVAMLGYRWATRFYGPGMQTAARTAVVAWLTFWVIPMTAMQPMRLFPDVLLLWAVVAGAADAAAGIILGAWLYDRARWRSRVADRLAYPQPQGIPS